MSHVGQQNLTYLGFARIEGSGNDTRYTGDMFDLQAVNEYIGGLDPGARPL